MASKPCDIESLLRAAFLKSELEFLKSQRRFLKALAAAKKSSDFERLCALSEKLLEEHRQANPSARRLRQSSKPKR